jgi:hypothetical protein
MQLSVQVSVSLVATVCDDTDSSWLIENGVLLLAAAETWDTRQITADGG